MEIHELTPEQNQIANALDLTYTALLKAGTPTREAVHIVVAEAKEAAEFSAE